MTKSSVFVGLALICCFTLWAALLYSVLTSEEGMTAVEQTRDIISPMLHPKKDILNNVINDITADRSKKKLEPKVEPVPLEEIRHNISLYLNTLHQRLGAIAGPKLEAPQVWDTFLDVTANTLVKWDDENRNRFPTPRKDGSIFVSLGTYRDPYCPMTIKSLYAMAKNPEKLYVSLFQQNCFEKTCKTGVLKGGAIEETVRVTPSLAFLYFS